MPSPLPPRPSFSARSPRLTWWGAILLLFYLTLPSQGRLFGSIALATPLSSQSLPLQATRLSSSETSTPEKPMLPQVVADKVLQTLAQKTHRPTRAFTIQSSAANQWTDSCLGLAKAGELCAQVITPGWRVEVSDGQTRWIYRTDQRGKIIRLETSH